MARPGDGERTARKQHSYATKSNQLASVEAVRGTANTLHTASRDALMCIGSNSDGDDDRHKP
jgi:hypothetical protein